MNVEFKSGTKILPGQLPCVLPEQVLEYLLTDCGLAIDDAIGHRYWSHLEEINDEVAIATREFRRLAGRHVVWPLGLHGDDANMGLVNAPCDKIVGVFLNIPIYRPRSMRISRFYLFSCEVSRMVDIQRTLNPVLKEIVQSSNKCISVGVCGRRFLLTELRGDQVWFRQIFQHKSSWSAVNICFRCGASTRQGPLNYLVYDGWRHTTKSTNDFLVAELPTEWSCLTLYIFLKPFRIVI